MTAGAMVLVGPQVRFTIPIPLSPQVVTRYMSLGRFAPRLAFDVAVSARKAH